MANGMKSTLEARQRDFDEVVSKGKSPVHIRRSVTDGNKMFHRPGSNKK